MEAENLGRRFSPQGMGLSGPQSRFRYGIHFSNAPANVHLADLEQLFTDFGPCRVMMDPGARHGWVGYDSIQQCNSAFAGMNPNVMGMYIRKGPYEAGPIMRPPMGDPFMGDPFMGDPSMGGSPMGGFRKGVPMMGGEYPRNYGLPVRMSMGPRRPPMDYYNCDYYEDRLFDVGMPYEYSPLDEMCLERPGCAVGPCTLCAVRTSYSCERCGAFYCSERCQRQDWSVHRESCDKNIPALNFGPRNRGGGGDMTDVTERMQRLPVVDHPDGSGGADCPNGGAQEGRSPSGSRPNEGECSDGRTIRTDRLQNSGHPDSDFEAQRRCAAPDDQRPSNAADRNDDQSGSSSGFPPRDNDQRRTDSFPQRNNAQGDRRTENGFGGGDSRPMGERRNESGFDRRGDGDRRPMGERRNENGFGGDGERRPVGERRNDNRFGDSRGDDRRPMGERRGDTDRRNDGGFSDRRSGGNQNRDLMPGSSGVGPTFRDNKKPDKAPEPSFGNAKDESRKSAVSKTDNSVVAVSGSNVKKNVAFMSLLKKVDQNVGGASSPNEIKKVELQAEKCIKFKVNDPVVITYAAAMDSIHVTPPTSAYSKEFLEVFAGVAAHCKNAPSLDRAPAPNEMVACQFVEDNEFYRAILKEVLPGGDYVMEFCDFGNAQKCKADKLREIPEELKECPHNSVKVSLLGVVAVPITGEIQKFLEDLIDNEIKLKIQFEGDISRGVELIMPNGDSVNKEVTSLIRQAAAPEKKDTPAPKADVPAPAHVQPRTPEKVLESLLSKMKLPVPESPTLFPAEEGICTDLKNDELVVITASTNTGSTYITRVTESSEMINLAIKLNEHCKTAPPLNREPREKELVACLYDLDKLYYRAVVSEVLPNKMYSMVFCDYGNSAKYNSDQLKAIPNELKMLPRQAVKVYFRDVDPVPVSGLVGEILARLSNESTQLKLRFNGSIENGVELIKPDGKSVNEELRTVISQVKAPQTANKAKPSEDFSPSASVRLPTDKPFRLLVFGILGDFLVAACNADAKEIKQFEETYAPLIAAYCENCTEKKHRPAAGDMCLAKFGDEWYRALTLSVNDDETREVFFVDYGNTHKVSPSDIRKIPQNIKSPLHTLTVCNVVGVPQTADAWAKIEERIQSAIDEQLVAVFNNVTSVMHSSSFAEVTIPDLLALFP